MSVQGNSYTCIEILLLLQTGSNESPICWKFLSQILKTVTVSMKGLLVFSLVSEDYWEKLLFDVILLLVVKHLNKSNNLIDIPTIHAGFIMGETKLFPGSRPITFLIICWKNDGHVVADWFSAETWREKPLTFCT